MTRAIVLDARTATPHFPGIGRYVVNLARSLPQHMRADESLILLRSTETPTLVAPADKTREVQLSASPFSLSQQWAVPRVLVQQDAALYHSPYLLMPYRQTRPTILTVYDLIPLLMPRQSTLRARLIFRWAMTLAIRASSRCVAISGNTATDLRRYFGVEPGKICVIPLAADPIFRPASSKAVAQVQEHYGLPARYFFSLGSNKPHKNLVRLVEVWDRLGRNAPILVIAGPWDPHYPEARLRATGSSADPRIQWLGQVEEDDLPALYGGATGFIFPSRYEGFGLPVLEAMACGTPVVCSSTSSLPEVAGDAALQVDPESTDEIAGAVTRLIDEPNLTQRLIQLGFERSSGFTWEETARQHANLYHEIMDRSP